MDVMLIGGRLGWVNGWRLGCGYLRRLEVSKSRHVQVRTIRHINLNVPKAISSGAILICLTSTSRYKRSG